MSKAPRQPLSPPPPPPPLRSLHKQRSWTPDVVREEAWLKRSKTLRRRSMSVTDADVDELKACMELGFGFDHPDPKLSDTFPALEIYYAVNNQYSKSLSRSSSISSSCSTDSGPDMSCPSPLLNSGDDPETVKMRLRQWAQVVAVSVRHCSSI